MEQVTKPHPAIVVMGGGTGSSNLLRDLRNLTPDITAIVSTLDDGSSTGRLRIEHNIPAPGDIRRAIGALARDETEGAALEKRLPNGHTVGNLELVEHIANSGGDFEAAIEAMHRRLGGIGCVVPVCLDPSATLVMQHGDKTIVGEHAIDTFPISDPNAFVITTTDTQKPAKANPAALAAVRRASMIVIAPGSPLTSLAAVLAPEGMSEALRDAKLVVAIANLAIDGNYAMDQRHVADHVRELERYMGGRRVDAVLYNNDVSPLPPEVTPLAHDEAYFTTLFARIIGKPLVGATTTVKSKYDHIRRDGLTHDAAAVTESLYQLLKEWYPVPAMA